MRMSMIKRERERVFDPMEGVLTKISDPNVVFEIITSQKSYLAHKPEERNYSKVYGHKYCR